MRISREEKKYLASLYEEANTHGDKESWDKVNFYFVELGEKYKFDPSAVVIDTQGHVYEIKECYICRSVANTYNECLYDETNGGKKPPICHACYVKKYPDRLREELGAN